jgi:hypothetical protein
VLSDVFWPPASVAVGADVVALKTPPKYPPYPPYDSVFDFTKFSSSVYDENLFSSAWSVWSETIGLWLKVLTKTNPITDITKTPMRVLSDIRSDALLVVLPNVSP